MYKISISSINSLKVEKLQDLYGKTYDESLLTAVTVASQIDSNIDAEKESVDVQEEIVMKNQEQLVWLVLLKHH